MSGEGPELVLDAARFSDIPGFYAEVNRIFMAGEDWQLGESLDALDDLFYGGYGVAAGLPGFRLIWKDIGKSRADLGPAATRDWLRGKLARPDLYDEARIRRQLGALERGIGQSFFDILLEIIADHPGIRLVPA